MNHYWQSDPKWAKIPLGTGTTGTTISSHGCKLTALSHLNYTDPVETQKLLLKGGAFKTDLIDDLLASKALNLVYDGRKPVGAIPAPDYVCMLEVKLKNAKKSQHFVTWMGFDNKILDPLDGRLKANGYTPISWRLFHEKKPVSPVLDTAIKVLEDDLLEYVKRRLEQFRREVIH